MSKLNVLVSYEYINKGTVELLAKHQDEINLIIDSGAFSAFTLGKEIRLDDYCSYIRELKKEIKQFNYIQLDVVFNPEKTRENFNRMLDAGFDTCPVFTRGEKYERLTELIDQGYYVFVGGVQRGDNFRGFAKYILERTKGKRVHYLAFTKENFIRKYAPYSVDSSTWANCFRFGSMEIYSGFGVTKKLSRADFQKPLPNETKYYLKKIGVTDKTIDCLRDKTCWTYSGKTDGDFLDVSTPKNSLAASISIASKIYQAVDLEKNIGTKTYFAIGTKQHLNSFLQMKKQLEERGVI